VPLPAPRPYWSLRAAAIDGLSNPVRGSARVCVDQLDALLSEAVRCRLYSDVPLGALLSGGVDSSLVVAMMQEASSRPVKTYTIGFSEQEFNEAKHAASVAAHVGTDHTELLLTGEDAHGLVPRLADVFDEPLADPSQLPTLLVSQLARRHVTVALCGDGGDELFAGYNRYVYGTRMLPRVERVPRLVRQSVAAGIGSVPAAAWDRVHAIGAAVLPKVAAQRLGERVQKIGTLMGAASVGDMYRSLLSAWQQPEELTGALPEATDVNRDILAERTPLHLLDRMMLADQSAYLPDDLLAKMDRASMAASLEVRAPLLDHRIAEFSWRLPPSMKVRDGVGKWILREVLYRRVPRALIDRPKMGFTVPIDRWLSGPLRTWADDLLAPDALQDGGLEAAPVTRAWSDLKEGRRCNGASLWAVLMFQAWRQRWQA
jgi:asparagine synthase (glutamine-hydrolysing)